MADVICDCGKTFAGRNVRSMFCSPRCAARVHARRQQAKKPGRKATCLACTGSWEYASKGGAVARLCPSCTETLRWCYACKAGRPLVDFTTDRSKPDGTNRRCRDCAAVYSKANPPDSATYRRWLLKERGLTPADFEAMVVAQGGNCAICLTPPKRWFAIDHDHATGKVRGLLCTNCNTGIGMLKDDLEVLHRAQVYLSAQIDLLAS